MMETEYVAIQQMVSGAVQVIAGDMRTTDARELEQQVRHQLRLAAAEGLQSRGVAIVPRTIAWSLFRLAMVQWTSGVSHLR